MMKSFFKKLSLVMALAMVVSLVAPAGSAFAAEAGIALQGTKTVVDAIDVEVGGDVVDLCFLGAPADWKSTFKWTPGDETIASVDKAGKVTGLMAGETTVTITAGADGSYKHTVKVVVVDPTANTYEFKQVSHKQATFTFAKDVNYTANDVTLVKVFEGGYEVNWPIETFKCEKNVVTVEPYVAFADGDEYIIKIGAEDEGTTFKTTLGAVDYIEIAYKSLDKDGKAYAKLEDDDEDIEVKLSVKLFSNGVNVTEAAGYDLENVEFELVQTSDNYDIDEDILVFEKYGEVATVKATYTAADESEWSNVATIISEPAPRYTIVSVDKWTLVDADKEDLEIDWSKSLWHSIPAFDDNMDVALVVLMTDSYGNKIVYPSEYADCSKKINNKAVLGLDDITSFGADNYNESAEDFEIHFTSTNENKVFVGSEDGLITTLGESKAPILVSLYDKNDDNDLVLVKNLFAAGLEVTSERVPTKITASVWFNKLLVDLENVVAPDFEKGTVMLKVVDQYGDAVTGQYIEISEGDDKISVSGGATTTANWWEAGQAYFTFNGEDFKYVNNKEKTVAVDSVKFTAKLPWPYNNVSTTFTVKTDSPEVEDGKLVVEGYEIAADSKDMKVAKQADGTTVSGNVTVYETSNGLRVAVADEVTLLTQGSEYLQWGKGAFSIKSKNATAGALYAVVYQPNGEAVWAKGDTTGIEGANGAYTVTAATPKSVTPATGAALQTMDYMATGDYTVKLYQVTKVYTDGEKNAKVKEISGGFNLKNSSATVSVKEQKYIDLPANDIYAETFEDVLFEAFNFNLDSTTLNEDVAKVVDASTKYNASSDSLYIYKVKFAVPLNNDGDTVYYLYEVTINRAVKVGDEYTHLSCYDKDNY